MKYCIFCGTQLDDEAVFCSACGNRQSAQNAPMSGQQAYAQPTGGQQAYEQPIVNGYDGQAQQGYAQPVNDQQPVMNGYDGQAQQPYAQPVNDQQPVMNGYNGQVQQGYAQPVNDQQPVMNGYDGQVQQGYSQPVNGQQPVMNGYDGQAQQGYAQPANPSQDNIQAAGRKGKKSKKKLVILTSIIAGILVIGAVTFFLFKDKLFKSDEEKALDRYFQAYEDMDLEALDKACYPEETRAAEEKGFNGKRSLASLYGGGASSFVFSRGALITNNDRVWRDIDVFDMYLRSYGFDGYKNGIEDYRSVMENNEEFKKHFSDLKVDYKLLKIWNKEDCKFYEYHGRKAYDVDAVSWMENKLNGGNGYYTASDSIRVEDVKVAIVNIKWSYGSKKYGYDKAWWNNEGFQKALVKQFGGSYFRSEYDAPVGRHKMIKVDYSNYDSLMNYMDSMEYELILYKTGGKWYIYPEVIRSFVRGPVVEFSYPEYY